MADYTPNEIVDMIMVLGECNGVYIDAATLYAERFPNRRHPSNVTIRDLARRARAGRLSRKRRHYEYNEDDVRTVTILAMVHLNPQISSRQIERETGIPKSTALRILKRLKYHAYHITLTQELQPQDFAERLAFCQWAIQRPELCTHVMFSDEATFKNTGELNRHNCHYWSDVNPHWYRTVDHQHQWKLNVWCGILNGYLIGPYFFNENVDGFNFLELLRDHLPALLEDVDLDTRQRMWIQLDGAPPHFALIVRDFLNQTYPNRWIGRGGPIAWPARSPDLTSPDFYLWGYLKNVVYEQQPTTREDMMERIRTACRNIPRNVLLSTVTHFRKRIAMCIAANGGHIEPTLNS